MRQTLGTKILGVTDRYYLPFRLPSDIYFSDIFVKTAYDVVGVPVSYAAYIRVLVYESESDYVEVAGVPAGNPLILFEGWVRNNLDGDTVRIPINYVSDLTNYSRYIITADYTNSYVGQLTIDVLYSDIVSPSKAVYNPKDHQGFFYYTVRVATGAGGGGGSITLQWDGGEWFQIQDLSLFSADAVANSESVGYKLGSNRATAFTYGMNDYIFLDPRYRGRKLQGIIEDVYIYVGAAWAATKHLNIRLYGYVRTANLPSITLSGFTKTNEAFIIY